MRALGLAAALLLLGGCGSAGAAHPQSQTTPTPGPTLSAPTAAGIGGPTTTLDVDALPTGPAPTTYYDPIAHVLHDGAVTSSFDLPGLPMGVAQLTGGHLLLSDKGVWRLDASGAHRVPSDYPGEVAAAGGSAFGVVRIPSTGTTATAMVFSATDGRRIAEHRFDVGQGTLNLLAVDQHAAVIALDGRIQRWTYAGDRVADLARTPGAVATRISDDGSAAGLLDLKSDRYLIGSLRGGSTWALARHQVPSALSPDGRYILVGTAHNADPRGYDVYDLPLTVYDVATGKPVRSFTGTGFGWTQGPVWDSDTSFLVQARPPHYPAPIQRLTWLRCTVAGSCVKAAPTAEVNVDKVPYVVGAWIVGDTPSPADP